MPLVVTAKLVVAPAHMVELEGCDVMLIAVPTVNIAPVDVAADGQAPVTITRYLKLFITSVVGDIDKVAVVTPE